MAISAKLKRRWSEYHSLAEILAATRNFSVSPFGTTETGLLDFRGIQVSNPPEQPEDETVNLRNIALRNADFSGSAWRGIVLWNEDNSAKIENVVFNESRFGYWFGATDYHMAHCSFVNCTYKHTAFHCRTVTDCAFERIKKSSRLGFWVKEHIENCRFTGEMVKINFGSSPLKNCVFEGRLYDCAFAGMKSETFLQSVNTKRPKTAEDLDNRMAHIDFSKAEVILTTFNAYMHLDLVTPSPQNCLVKMTDAFYSELCRLIREKGGEFTETMLRNAHAFCRPHEQCPYSFYHREDSLYNTPEFQEIYYQLICEAAENTGVRQ